MKLIKAITPAYIKQSSGNSISHKAITSAHVKFEGNNISLIKLKWLSNDQYGNNICHNIKYMVITSTILLAITSANIINWAKSAKYSKLPKGGIKKSLPQFS